MKGLENLTIPTAYLLIPPPLSKPDGKKVFAGVPMREFGFLKSVAGLDGIVIIFLFLVEEPIAE